MYVLYEKPSDFPHSWVVRRLRIVGERSVPDPLPLAVGPSAEGVRPAIPRGLYQVQWPGQDPDPVISEVWV